MLIDEIKIISQYASSELAGGLMLGKFALSTTSSKLKAKLIFHSYDELKHSWLWSNFLEKNKVNLVILKARNEYFDWMNTLTDEIEFLASVHVYELRVPFHLKCHMQINSISNELKTLIDKIQKDEKYHLNWIHDFLLDQNQLKVLDAIKKAEKYESIYYLNYMKHLDSLGGYYKEIANLIKSKEDLFIKPLDAYKKALGYEDLYGRI